MVNVYNNKSISRQALTYYVNYVHKINISLPISLISNKKKKVGGGGRGRRDELC